MVTDFRTAPVDETSRARLEQRGLRYGLVDTSDTAAFDEWLQNDIRGFHGPALTDEQLGWWREGLGYRRTTGVWHDDLLVGTTNSWPSPQTVPGGRTVESWGISSVTVAPTHRRRGIARGLLEGELRTAAALGIPVAMLTVSEATLYERYGFAPAAYRSDFTIDTRRSAWAGGDPDGTISLITLTEWEERINALHERVRLASPGSIPVWPLRWRQISGTRDTDSSRAAKMRALQYTDESGEIRGLALYSVGGGDDDFTQHHLDLQYLSAETDDAYAALWRFVLEVDLVTEVRAWLRPVDEPLRWMVRDQRGIRQTVTDHQWVRILDVVAALEARGYEQDGRLELDITDDLGFASGRFTLDVVDGTAIVTPGGGGTAPVTVQQLSAAYLGAVPPVTPQLGLLRTARAPYLSVWY
jgi:predicted acetyltransferase